MQAAWTDQRAPALAIVARGDQIQPVAANHYAIRSQSHPERSYAVAMSRGQWICECDHHREAGRDCIHILAAKFRADLQVANLTIEKPFCPECKSGRVVANGKRQTNHGAVRVFRCRACGHYFSANLGFEGRHADPARIALALDLYFRGLSVRKVADHFQQTNGATVSHMTVYRWVVHYSALAARWMDAQGAKVGSTWHMDETVVNLNGAHCYLWNVMDRETRFLLATHISRNRSMENTRAPLQKAKAATLDRPTEVRTDGMNAYHDAIGKELGHIGGPTGWVNPHHRVPSIRAKDSNNRIERLHGSEKERTKVMRGFDNEKGAASLAEGYRVHYNLVRPHMGLDGATPGEAAEIEVSGGFRWESVLMAATGKTLGQPQWDGRRVG